MSRQHAGNECNNSLSIQFKMEVVFAELKIRCKKIHCQAQFTSTCELWETTTLIKSDRLTVYNTKKYKSTTILFRKQRKGNDFQWLETTF